MAAGTRPPRQSRRICTIARSATRSRLAGGGSPEPSTPRPSAATLDVRMFDDAVKLDAGSRDRRRDVTGQQETRRRRPPGNGAASRTWNNGTSASTLRLLVYQLTTSKTGSVNRRGLYLPLLGSGVGKGVMLPSPSTCQKSAFSNSFLPEDQHPLKGQRAANFRLLAANQ